MIRSAEHLIDKIKDLKDEMRLMGIDTIDLNYTGECVTHIRINDAETYAELVKQYQPYWHKSGITRFNIGGWLDIIYGGRTEGEQV